MNGLDGARPLDALDHALAEEARATLLRVYRPLWHTIAAALRSADGRVWTGVHLGATVGRLSVCAEAVALGRAVLEGDGTVRTIVAFRHPKPDEDAAAPELVAPCGACRDMLADHAPDARVIVPGPDGPLSVPLRTLLPLPYRR